MSYPASEDGESPERRAGGAGGAPASLQSAYYSGNSQGYSSEEELRRAQQGARDLDAIRALSRASFMGIQSAHPSPAVFGAGGWGAGGWGAGVPAHAPVPVAAELGGAAAAPAFGAAAALGAAAPAFGGHAFNPLGGLAGVPEAAAEVNEENDGLAAPAPAADAEEEVPLDPCRVLTIQKEETLNIPNITKQSFSSYLNRNSILQKILDSSMADAAAPAGPAKKSGFEVLMDKNHPYFFLALKAFIACFLLDGLGHDQIYGDNPNVKEMLQACISSYGDLLTPEYRAELKAAVLKKDGINDTNAKSTILALCKELRVALGIDNEPAKIEVTNAEMSTALGVMQGGAKGPKVSKKQPQATKGTAKKEKGRKEIRLSGSFQNTKRKPRVRIQRVSITMEGKEKASARKPKGQVLAEKDVQDYFLRVVGKETNPIKIKELLDEQAKKDEAKRQTKLKQDRKKAIGKIAEALPAPIQALGEKAKAQLIEYYPAGGNDIIGYSIDSLTASTWKGLVKSLIESHRQQCVLNTASSRGDPASFNPTVWGPNNQVSLATYTGTHTTRGAVGFPIYCERTQMTLLDPDIGRVRKELILEEGRSMKAEFVSKGVTITEMKDLANAIQGLPTNWISNEEGSVYTRTIDGFQVNQITFTGDFTPSEKLILGCGLKTDGDIGGLRFISGLQDEPITYEIQHYNEMHAPIGDPVEGSIANLVTMTFDIICAELAATFSGQGVFKMKPSGEVHILKPIHSRQALTAELLQALHTKIKHILDNRLPVWKVVTSTAVEVREGLEPIKEILALRTYLCDARELKQKIMPAQKNSKKRQLERAREELGEDRRSRMKSIIESLAESHTQASRAELNTRIESFLRENDAFFTEKYEEYIEEKNSSELHMFRRKGLTESGNTIFTAGKEMTKNELTAEMNRFLAPIVRAAGPNGLAPFQDLMKDIYFDLTVEQIHSQIQENLLYNSAFNDPIKILNANSYPALNKIYANPDSFLKELSGFNTYWFELRNELLFLFSHKWDVNDKLKLYRQLKEIFERQPIRASNANLASIMICAYIFPLTSREYQSLEQEVAEEAAAAAAIVNDEEENGLAVGEGEGDADEEENGAGAGDGGEFVEGEGDADEDDESIWNELVEEDVHEQEDIPEPHIFKSIKSIYKDYVLKDENQAVLESIGSHKRIKKNFLIPYIRVFLTDSKTTISPADAEEQRVFGGGGHRKTRKIRKSSK